MNRFKKSNENKPTGRFITLEGGEGSGKSTLCCQLRDWLQTKGIDCLITQEPGGISDKKDSIGQQLRSLLLCQRKGLPFDATAELFLFLASQFQNLFETIMPALKKGSWVICDRFVDSTLAYQGYGRFQRKSDNFKLAKNLSDRVLKTQPPDLTFVLDLDPVIGLQRTRKVNLTADRIESESLAFHERVRVGYLELLTKFPSRIARLDAEVDQTLLKQKAIALIQQRFLKHVDNDGCF